MRRCVSFVAMPRIFWIDQRIRNAALGEDGASHLWRGTALAY